MSDTCTKFRYQKDFAVTFLKRCYKTVTFLKRRYKVVSFLKRCYNAVTFLKRCYIAVTFLIPFIVWINFYQNIKDKTNLTIMDQSVTFNGNKTGWKTYRSYLNIVWAKFWVIFFHKSIRSPWGRCYDHNFLRFFSIFGEKIGVFIKNQRYDQLFSKLGFV
jgi:hypothetical protein